jgi:hypothetical protein
MISEGGREPDREGRGASIGSGRLEGRRDEMKLFSRGWDGIAGRRRW